MANKKYAHLNLTPEEEAFVERHEQLWEVFMHNKHIDEGINALLKLHGIPLPADSDLGWAENMSAEEIYAKLVAEGSR